MARAPQTSSAPDADVVSIRELFRLGRFEPARAQRDYQWERPQWSDLLNDLTDAFRYAGLDPAPATTGGGDDDEDEEGGWSETTTEEPVEAAVPIPPIERHTEISHYYLGHILLFPRNDPRRFFIYDGQQRFTTLTLLLCALRDSAGADGEWYPIQAILRTDPPDNLPRLTVPTRGNALARIVETLHGAAPLGGGAPEPADHRMYNAAKFFGASVKGWRRERQKAFAAFLLDKVYVTVTRMRDRAIAEYAYITINTRGKPLESKDIIKGHFIQLASRQSLTAANEMGKLWTRLENAAGKRLDDILRIAFLLDYRAPATFDFGAQLMDHFQDEKHLEDVTKWVGVRLPAIIDLHGQWILDPLKRQVLGPPASNLRRMTFLPWNQWQALAIHFAERDRKAPKRFSASIAALERWCFCMNLLDMSDDLITQIVIKALDQGDPFGPQGALRLFSSSSKRARARLHDGQITDDERRGAHVRWMETLYWPQDAVNFAVTNGSSVEHVLPRSATGQWLTDFPAAMLIHTELFGNLRLVPRNLNETLGNGQYVQKRPALRALPPQYKSAHDVANAEQWTMAAVQKRTDQLAKVAAAALRLSKPSTE